MCEISNTFSEVVICRRFGPAGGQPLFRVFLRLPDHNPLKRLEAFFRVISLGNEEGVRLIRRDPASFYPTRCKTPSAVLVSSVLAAPEIVLRARGVLGLARNTTPDEDYAKEDSSILFFSILRNYPFAPFPPRLIFLPFLFLSRSFLLLLSSFSSPRHGVAVRKLK